MSSSKLVLFKLKSELFKFEFGDLSLMLIEAFMSLMLFLLLFLTSEPSFNLLLTSLLSFAK